MPLVFGVLVDVFLRKAAEENAVETGMESVQVGITHVTDARLGLGRETLNGSIFGESPLQRGTTVRIYDGQCQSGVSHTNVSKRKRFEKTQSEDGPNPAQFVVTSCTV